MATITGSQSLKSSLQVSSTTIPGAVPLATSLAVGFKPAQPPGTIGTADNADLAYVKTLTLSATPTALDLTNLTDPYGNGITFARIRSIYLKNRSTINGQTVAVGFASTTSNSWVGPISNPGQITIQPSTSTNDGVLYLTAPNTSGWAVSSTSKLLNLDPGSYSITIDLILLGCSV
jgi:hypothetical protein